MKKRAFTVVEIMIVVLVIALLFAIATPQFMKAREGSQQTTCDENRWKVDQAKTLWIQNTGQDGSAVPTASDLAPDYLQRMPACPTGAVFVIGNGDVSCYCPDHSGP